MPISDVWILFWKNFGFPDSDVWILDFRHLNLHSFCLFSYLLENSNLNRFVMILFVVIIYYAFDDSYLGIFEYPFRWILYRFLWILFTSSNVNFTNWLFLQSSFVICHFKNIKVSILVVNIKTLSSNDFNTILLQSSFSQTDFQSISIYKPLPHSYEKSN